MILEKDIGKAIKKAREEAGLTQEKLSELVDISTIYLSHIETGRKMPSVTTLYHIAIELNMSIDNIFFQRQISSQFTLIDIEKKLSNYTIKELTLISLIIDSIHEVYGNRNKIE